MATKVMRTYRSTDGTDWGVEIITPSNSSAMILFRHPHGDSSGRDRYNTVQWHGSEARNVTARLDKTEVLESLSESEIAMLFRRSRPIQTHNAAPVALPNESVA